jgi:hypothetical protein
MVSRFYVQVNNFRFARDPGTIAQEQDYSAGTVAGLLNRSGWEFWLPEAEGDQLPE